MDPFNQWGDENQTESHEMNEHAPINYNQNTYMTNDGREPSVESLNIDSMQAKRSERMGESRKSYHYEVALESNFWKYTEQTKSILAGSQFYKIQLKHLSNGNAPFNIMCLCVVFVCLPSFFSRTFADILRWNAYGMVNLSSGTFRYIGTISQGNPQIERNITASDE